MQERGSIIAGRLRRALNAVKARGGKIVAVGTTSLRLLESATDEARNDFAPFFPRDESLHHARLPLPLRRSAADQFSSAALDPVHAGRRLLRARSHAARLCARGPQALSLLFLRRCLSAQPGASAMSELFSFALKAQDGVAASARSPRRAASSARRPSCRSAPARPSRPCFPRTCKSSGADIILANTYHLMLRPGAERIAKTRRARTTSCTGTARS